jgi:hypothetical protein
MLVKITSILFEGKTTSYFNSYYIPYDNNRNKVIQYILNHEFEIYEIPNRRLTKKGFRIMDNKESGVEISLVDNQDYYDSDKPLIAYYVNNDVIFHQTKYDYGYCSECREFEEKAKI